MWHGSMLQKEERGWLTGSIRRQWSSGGEQWKNTGKNQYALGIRRRRRYKIGGKRKTRTTSFQTESNASHPCRLLRVGVSEVSIQTISRDPVTINRSFLFRQVLQLGGSLNFSTKVSYLRFSCENKSLNCPHQAKSTQMPIADTWNDTKRKRKKARCEQGFGNSHKII